MNVVEFSSLFHILYSCDNQIFFFSSVPLQGVFITYDQEKIYTYVYCRETINGMKVEGPRGAVPTYRYTETSNYDPNSSEFYWLACHQVCHFGMMLPNMTARV